jgi:hypothetical protein
LSFLLFSHVFQVYRDRVFLIAGNHELMPCLFYLYSDSINNHFSNIYKVKQSYGSHHPLVDKMFKVFRQLPLAAILTLHYLPSLKRSCVENESSSIYKSIISSMTDTSNGLKYFILPNISWFSLSFLFSYLFLSFVFVFALSVL